MMRSSGAGGGGGGGGGAPSSLTDALQSLSWGQPGASAGAGASGGAGTDGVWNSMSSMFNGGVDPQDSLHRGFTQLKTFWSSEPAFDPENQQQSLHDEMSEYLNMSYTQRLSLFVMCFAGGVAMLFFAFMWLPMIVLKPAKFGLAFTFGNVMCVSSTVFLVGPKAQLSAMFHPVRAYAAYAYCGAIAFTLFACFNGGSLRYLMVLVALIVEVLALLWYALSYIPYGRQLISSLIPLS
ncbi:Vesicle transport protein SFT2B [Porphyridium purpureum]|uniref:Vesicle transport protein n=1 Tax=Porphyridium purpureum TaxID=35688 RepID=A0A5J4YSK3_PORPP|nr:Vesicle transport protein SFT2B [Porphyridium purpureum]|eukprot:POR4979..scf236_6